MKPSTHKKMTGRFKLPLLALLLIAGCDLIDATEVRNPGLTLDRAVEQPESARAWLNGLRQRTAEVYNTVLVTSELSTDNYVNEANFFNRNVDNGIFRDSDPHLDDVQFQIARLREQARFGLEVILAEHDIEAAGTEIEAEYHFYLGWSHLLAGELFVALPDEPEGAAVSPQTHFQHAVSAFNAARQIDPQISYRMGLARAHYNLGNRAEAVEHAEQVVAADPEFLRLQEFDLVNNPANLMEAAVYGRQTFNDLQPLPRLDFLDPKYGDLGGTEQSPVIMQSAEEAYLILAEAQLSEGDLNGARSTLLDLLDLVGNRPVREFDETNEPRQGSAGPEQRPNSSQYRVRAAEGEPFREGLVLDRTAATPVPVVSGTSVTAGQINALSDPDGDALELLYLVRQEVFFGEGRRMFDLGIRWPVSQTEALNNPNIADADRTAHIPSWMPADYSSINAWSADGFDVTIAVNLNRILAEQKGNRFD